jgi:hypothetical protein
MLRKIPEKRRSQNQGNLKYTRSPPGYDSKGLRPQNRQVSPGTTVSTRIIENITASGTGFLTCHEGTPRFSKKFRK